MVTSSPDSRPPFTSSRTPIVGREKELERVRTWLLQAREAGLSVGVIGGEPGIGKTRLLLALADAARVDGWLVAWSRGRTDEGVPPFLPIAEIIRALLPGSADHPSLEKLTLSAPDLVTLIPELRPSTPASDFTPTSPTRFQVLEGITEFLTEAADGPEANGLLLIVDDVHWVDAASLDALLHLLHGSGERRLLIATSYRTTEVAPSHPAFAFLSEVSRRRWADQIILRPISDPDAAGLISTLNGGAAVAPAVQQALIARGGGNPFYLEELVWQLHAEQIDLRDPGAALATTALPEGVRHVVGARLHRLGEPIRTVLQAAAVLGDEFRTDILESVTRMPHADLLASLDGAERSGMVAGYDGRWAFRHPLIRQTCYESLSEARRRSLHLSAARAFAAVADSDAAAGTIALHYRAAGDLAEPGAAFSRTLRAVDVAERLRAWEEAAELLGWCLHALEDSVTARAAQADAAAVRVRLARSHAILGNAARAAEALSEARSIAVAGADWPGLARATLPALEVWHAPEAQLELIDEAFAYPGAREPFLEAQLWVQRARFDVSGDAAADALAHARRLATQHGYIEIEAQATTVEAARVATAGQLFQAALLFDVAQGQFRSLDMSEQSMDSLVYADVFRTLVYPRSGMELLAHVVDLTAAKQVPWLADPCLIVLTSLAAIRCAPVEANAIAARVRGSALNRGYATAMQAITSALFDDAEEGLSLATRVSTDQHPLLQLTGIGVLARIEYLRGNTTGARAATERWSYSAIPSLAARSPYSPHVWWSAGSVGEALAALGDDASVRAAYEVYAALTELRVTASGSADTFRGQLALRLGLREEARRWLRAGLDWARTDGFPLEEGRALFSLAELALAERRTAEARGLLDEAEAVFQARGVGLYVGAISRLRTQVRPAGESRRSALPAGITLRERDVLRLLAAGRSNAQIAAKLRISIRTVDRHVENLYARIGVHNRAQATAFAVQHNLG